MAKTTEGGSNRRDFLKAATTAAGAIVAGAVAREAEAQTGGKPAAKPTAAKPAAAPPAGQVTAGGIPVPTVDAKQLRAGLYPKGTVMATGRAIGANDRIVLGFIGLGGQGTFGHLRGFVADGLSRNTKVVALCDAYTPYLDRAKGIVTQGAEKGGDANPFQTKDYRKILERKDIDAVMIATPEHWHGQVAVHAMDAGKHVYCEKPMVRYVEEAFQVHDTAVRTKRVFQVGSQGCTDVKWHAAAK
ncbi:MAG: Gfo/Idh/MocA family protein, partial [Armatimonadota bacterium]